MKNLIKEFKEFINRGNVIDLAVAVVIGSAFTAIVNSVVNDLIMPLISLCTGGIHFEDMELSIGAGENAAAFEYGNFISAVIQFFIIAIVVFAIVKAINKVQDMFKKTEEEEEAEEPHCQFCLEEVKEGATRCPHCAGEFDHPAEKKTIIKEDDIEEEKSPIEAC